MILMNDLGRKNRKCFLFEYIIQNRNSSWKKYFTEFLVSLENMQNSKFWYFYSVFFSPPYSRLSDSVGNLWLCRWCIPTHHPVNDTWTPKRFTNAEYFCWLCVRCLGCEKKNVDWISKSKDDRSTLSHSSATPLKLLYFLFEEV